LRQGLLDGAHPRLFLEVAGLKGQFTHTHPVLERGGLLPEGVPERRDKDYLIAQGYGTLHQRHMPKVDRVETATVDGITTHARLQR